MTTDFAAQEKLSEYLDGELSGDELARMEAALEAEPALRAELDELDALVADLGSMPAARAPAGLLAAVLAQTADLAIGVDVDADLAAESGTFAAPPSITAAANVAFWKAPWFGAMAAMMLIGVGVVFTMKGQSPTMAPPSPVAFDTASEAMPSASGAIGGGLEGDAIVDAGLGAEAEEAARERLADRLAGEGESALEPLMETTPPRVMNGVTAPGPTEVRAPASRPAARRRSTPESAVGPEGVFEADWESRGDGVVMEDVPADVPADEEPLPEASMPMAGFAPDPVGLGDDADGSASVDDVTMADEPLEDYLDPAADLELAGAEERRAESAPAATGASRRAGRSSGAMADASSETKAGGGSLSLDEVTFTGVGGDGTLRLSPGVTPEMAITALRGNGVTVDVISVSSTRRVLQLTVAESGAATMTSVLRQHGALQYGRAAQVTDGRVSLRLTMRSAQ